MSRAAVSYAIRGLENQFSDQPELRVALSPFAMLVFPDSIATIYSGLDGPGAVMQRFVVQQKEYWQWLLLVILFPIGIYGFGIAFLEMSSICDQEMSNAILSIRPANQIQQLQVREAVFFAERKTAYITIAVYFMSYVIFCASTWVSWQTIRQLGDKSAIIFTGALATILALIGMLFVFNLNTIANDSCILTLYYDIPRDILVTYYQSIGEWRQFAGRDIFQWMNYGSVILTNVSWVFCCIAIFSTIYRIKASSNSDRDEAAHLSSLKLSLFNSVAILVASAVSLNTWMSWPTALVVDKSASNLPDFAFGLSFYYSLVLSLVLASVYLPALYSGKRWSILSGPHDERGEIFSLQSGLAANFKHFFAVFSPVLTVLFQQLFTFPSQ